VGQTIEIDAEGPQAREALDGVCQLIAEKFNEKD
jgi:phosphotransferase system HPr-like phosphotransfer protein